MNQQWYLKLNIDILHGVMYDNDGNIENYMDDNVDIETDDEDDDIAEFML